MVSARRSFGLVAFGAIPVLGVTANQGWLATALRTTGSVEQLLCRHASIDDTNDRA
jgi:hypothetical protein